jgi:predicted thioesterase
VTAAPPAFPGVRPGLTGARRVVVSEAMTTTHAGGRILTAPSMIMEMELTAQDVTQPFLPDDHTTVGYEICIRHRRSTPVGEPFDVTAELLEVDGRRLLFRVEARNPRELIGEGTLRRTIVRRGSVGSPVSTMLDESVERP